MKIKVITDSGSCLTQKQAQEIGIEFLPLQVSIEGHTYLDGIDLDSDLLYDFLNRGYMPQTSMPPLGFIEKMFEQFEKEEVTDVILITLSSGLSSTNATVQASAKWHGIQVHTLDIYTTLAVQRYLAIRASELVNQGIQIDEIMKRLEQSVNDSKGYLMPENMDHLARGGRLSPTVAKLAGMLKIVPILEVSKETEGKVGGKPEKVHTMTKAIKKSIKTVCDVKNVEDYEFFVMDSNADDYLQMAIEAFEEKGIHPQVSKIGAVIASHTGTGAIGIQMIKRIK
ncbi:DegV family protein [Floccifex sp.]|uniref:DegV family protein n=1 Tax=Floccifex sp. TaxID=2815810 RepID=UPI003F124E55